MKILLIQTAYLGDCVLSLPLINTLKKNLNCEIDIVTLPQTKSIFLSCPSVNEVLIYDKKKKDKGLKGIIKIINRIKIVKYNAVFLVQRSFRSGFIALLSGISQRIGFDRGGAKYFLTEKIEYNWNIHDIERQLLLAEAFGCKEKVREFNIRSNDGYIRKYESEFQNSQKKILGIAPQSEWETKCWPKENYLEIIKGLSHEYKIIVFGKYAEDWPADVLNLTGRTSMEELIALVGKVDVLLSNDSGIVHIAAALRKPVVAIFGSTVPQMGFAPFGNKHKIIEVDRKMKCRPCGLHGPKECPKGHFRCMLDIDPEIVKKGIYEVS